MQPYKRRRRTRRDMIVLGGWLFADLLLGLAMLFAVANTVGAPPPTPSPTPAPDYLATAESDLALQQTSSEQTAEALREQIANAELSAQQTAEAESTRAALSDSERATEDAHATQDAVVAQATIEALSTEQASRALDQEALNNELATTVAQATMVADQVQSQGTEQAALQAQATENAESGVNAQATVTALQSQIQSNADALATSQAQSVSSQSQVESAQATSAAIQSQAESAAATSEAAQNQLARAQQQVQLNSLNPNAVTETIQVDLNGVLSGDDDAIAEARDQLNSALGPYLNGESCRLGFVLISSRSGDLGEGVQLSERIGGLIESEFPDLLQEPANGSDRKLAYESIALPNTTPVGEVELLLFLSSGCQPVG
jgi:hypothetical protein